MTNEQLKKDLEETTAECQCHIDNVEAQHDELENQIEELKSQVPPKEDAKKKVETKKEDKVIYHKCGMMGKMLQRKDRSNWMQEEVLASDTKRIQSLVADGYEKKETELSIQFKK